jgi:flagellar basal body-associated protein FliL
MTINDIELFTEKEVSYLQGKTLYTILLSIIAVLTLSLAVLVIFIFTTYNGNVSILKNNNKKAELKERVVPIEEQVEFKLFGTEESANGRGAIFNIKSSKDHPDGFLMASISVVYDAGEKNKKLEERKELIEKSYLSEIKQSTIEYFRERTYEELQKSDGMKKSREDLKKIYNQIIGKNNENIIIKVIFDQWIIQ